MRLRRATGLEKKLGYRFRRPELLDAALTHRSYAHEQASDAHYERLEFLGDAVLGMVTAGWLFNAHPDWPEGDLSKRKGHLVSQPVLARHAAELGLGEALRLGVGEERSGGRRKASLLADVWEAVIGAVYLDGGLEAAAALIRPLLAAAVERRLGRRRRRQDAAPGDAPGARSAAARVPPARLRRSGPRAALHRRVPRRGRAARPRRGAQQEGRRAGRRGRRPGGARLERCRSRLHDGRS